MKRVYFGTMEELAAFMASEAEEKRSSVAVLFYDEAKELLRELLMYEEVDLNSAELRSPEWDGYNKEYYITLTPELDLFVEQAVGENGDYLGFEDDCLILGAGASSAIITKNYAEHAAIYEAVFADDEDFDCGECDLCASDCDKCENDDSATIHFEITTDGAHYKGTTTLGRFLEAFLD